MKKKTNVFVIVILSLLVNACNLNLSNNGVVIGPTSTPTAANLPAEDNPTATSAAEEIPTELSAPPAIQNIDVCGFFTTIDAEPIVGTALINVSEGSDTDDEGGALSYCNYIGDDVALVLSMSVSGFSKDSPDWQGKLLETTKLSEPNTVSEASAEIGEQAYWVVNEDSAGWYVAKYPYVFALVVGGNIGYAEDYKEDLAALAQRVAGALP